MGMPVVTVATGGLPIVESTNGFGTPVTEATNGRGVAVTKVISPLPGLPVIFETIGIAPSLTLATFNGTPTNTAVTNGGRTATHSSASLGGVASTQFFSSGKYYFEMTVGVTGGISNGIGIVNSGLDWSGLANTVLVALAPTSSILTSGGASTGYQIGTTSNGDVIGVAADLSAKLIWFRRNGGLWNGNGTANPVTGVNGVTALSIAYAPMVRFSGSSGDNITANFGQATYANAAPSGFGNWGV